MLDTFGRDHEIPRSALGRLTAPFSKGGLRTALAVDVGGILTRRSVTHLRNDR